VVEVLSEILAQRIKEARRLKSLVQEDLARSLGVTVGTISGYERDYREPDLKTLARLAELLGVTTDYLLGISNNPNNDSELKINGISESISELSKENRETLERLIRMMQTEERIKDEKVSGGKDRGQ
jgi:transcriptional regulator with XRE-family HTH domain